MATRYWDEFFVGDRVRLSDWADPDPIGTVVAVYPDHSAWCGDTSCCGPPTEHYDVLLDVPMEDPIELRVPAWALHTVIAQ